MCALSFLFIDEIFSHCPLWPKQGISESKVRPLVESGRVFLINWLSSFQLLSKSDQSTEVILRKIDIYIYIYIYIYMSYWPIGLVGRVCANDPGDQGSFQAWVMLKTQKVVLDTSLLNSKYYKVGIKGKVGPSWVMCRALPKPQCSSYWKGNLRVAHEYGRKLYFFLIYILLFFSISSNIVYAPMTEKKTGPNLI